MIHDLLIPGSSLSCLSLIPAPASQSLQVWPQPEPARAFICSRPRVSESLPSVKMWKKLQAGIKGTGQTRSSGPVGPSLESSFTLGSKWLPLSSTLHVLGNCSRTKGCESSEKENEFMAPNSSILDPFLSELACLPSSIISWNLHPNYLPGDFICLSPLIYLAIFLLPLSLFPFSHSLSSLSFVLFI